MSIIGSNILAGAAGSGVSAYEIEQSLRFDGSSHLNWTPSSTGDTGLWSFSCWYKKPVKSGLFNPLFMAGPGNWTYSRIACPDDAPHTLWVDRNGPAASYPRMWAATSYSTGSAWQMRDPSAWYHVLTTFDDSLTADNRMKFYINGVETPRAYEYSNRFDDTFDINRNAVHRLGYDTGSYLQGYMAEVNFVDGTALDPTDFGEYDDNGVWRPKRYTGSYGTNGFYLKFDPSATNGIGHDHSGNGNNWTPTGFSTTAGTGYDVMDDTPTTNYATLNPLRMNGTVSLSASLADGNLRFKSSSQYKTAIASIGMSTGKWYFEAETANAGGTGDANLVGIEIEGNPGANHYISSDPNGVTTGYGYLNVNGNLRGGTASADDQTGGATWTAGDIIGVTYDADAGQAKWYKNNTLVYTKSGLSGTWFFAVSGYDSSQSNSHFYVNFGQRAFAYAPPTGFKALNTSNLPAPDIADGSDYFNTVTYSGNSSTQSITGVGFQPDLLWIKRRNAAYSHQLLDAVRGKIGSDSSYARLASNLNNGEATPAGDDGVQSLNTDGFTTLADESYNETGGTYVAWNWLAGNGTSSNTDGSITSTVSANQTAGFSIVSYTAENAVRTIGHGLGVAPVMYMTKRYDAAQDWAMYWELLGATRNIKLNLISKNETDSTYWNNTAPTSAVFTVGTNTRTGGSTGNYIAYCFAEVEGFSKFSEYRGNGSTDGPAVFCGFRPSVLIIKNYAGGSETNWVIKDTVRDTYNPSTKRLNPNLSAVESDDSNVDIDFLSNGFKVRSTNTSVNENGSSYLFMAVAENPFGGSGVSPSTAR